MAYVSVSPSGSVAVTASPTLAPTAAFSATLRVAVLSAKAGWMLDERCCCCWADPGFATVMTGEIA